MNLKIYQIDAFASEVFSGNPAAVCILQQWLSGDVLQKIAMENNLSETAFAVQKGKEFELRWFTPRAEVALCGHATLACSKVIFDEYGYDQDQIVFQTRQSGQLIVERSGEWLVMDFPVDDLIEMEIDQKLEKAIGKKVFAQYKGKTDIMLVLEDQDAVAETKPNFRALTTEQQRGYIITAKGKSVDFVSRFFCPVLGIDEDPVTGSAHTTMTPYWAGELGKLKMEAQQISHRGGYLKLELIGNRVKIKGKAVKYLEGKIFI